MKSVPTIEWGKDGKQLEPKHPLPFTRAPSLLRSRISQCVATETLPGLEGRSLELGGEFAAVA